MKRSFGKTMDESEYEAFKKSYDERILEANKYLQSKEEAVNLGITTYSDLVQGDDENEKLNSLRYKIFHEEGVNVFWEIQAQNDMLESYNDKDDQNYGGKDSFITKDTKERLEEISNNGSYFPSLIFENYNELIKYTVFLIILSIAIMISTLFIKDRQNKLVYLQYSSKIGRNLFKKKLLAALIASFLLMTVQFTVFFILYSTNDTNIFFDMNVSSFYNGFTSWFDLTFGEYIILTVAAAYLLGLIFTVITAFLSSIVPNYLTIIGIQVPIMFVTFTYILKYFIERLTVITLPPYFLHISYTILVFVIISMIVIRWQKEKRIDILY
ncbi:ABC transporter permease [Metabacillus fastidiosus]|uniref:ABC transporter permease n=1 Tax=Metabacillus fastidiosus TaxID=1458 RepID=UPI003D27556C